MSARSLTTIKYLGLIAFAVFAVIGVVRLVMGDGTGWWWLVGGAVAAFGVAMRYLMVKTTSHIEPDRAD